MAHTHGDHAGYEVALLAQLGCHWKQAPLASYLKRFLFPAINSLPYSSVRETDIPSSQYKHILRFHYSTKVGQAHLLLHPPAESHRACEDNG